MPDPQPIEKVHNYLLDKKVKNIPSTPQELQQRLSEDDQLVDNVYGYLIGERVKNLPGSVDEFKSSLGVKKKELSTENLPQPAEDSGTGSTDQFESNPFKSLGKSAWHELAYTLPSTGAATGAMALSVPKDVTRIGESSKRIFDIVNTSANLNRKAQQEVDKVNKMVSRFTKARQEGRMTDQEYKSNIDHLSNYLQKEGFIDRVDFLQQAGFLDKPKDDKITQARKDLVSWANQRQQEGAEFSEDLVRTTDQVNDFMDALNYVATNVGMGIGQIPAAVGTLGLSSFSQEAGGVYLEGINRIAEKEGISPQEVIDRNLDDPAVAAASGMASALLDFVGAGQVMKSFGKGQIKNALRTRTGKILQAGATEAPTEFAQSLINQTGVNITSNDNEIDWKQAFEEGLAGGIAGGGVSTIGQSAGAARQKLTQDAEGITRQAETQSGQQAVVPGKEESLRIRDVEQTEEAPQQVPPQEEVTEEIVETEEPVQEIPEEEVEAAKTEQTDKTPPAKKKTTSAAPETRDPSQEEISEVQENLTRVAEESTSKIEAAQETPTEGKVREDTAQQTEPEVKEVETTQAVEDNQNKRVNFIFHDGETRQGRIQRKEGDKIYIQTNEGTIYPIKAENIVSNPYEGNKASFVVTGPGMGFAADVIPMTKKFIQQAGQAAKKYLTPKGMLPESVFKRSINMNAKVNRQLNTVKFLASDLRKAVKKEMPGGINRENAELVDQVLKGDADPQQLPAKVRKVTSLMRKHIDKLSKEMIRDGVVEGKLEGVVQDNLGTYMTRSYQLHNDPDSWNEFVKNKPEGQKLRNNAVHFIKSHNPQLTNDQVDGLVNELLWKPEGPLAVVRSSKLGAKDLGILTKRKDIAEPIRMLLGEYKDPLVNYARSVTKMAHLLEKHKFLTDVRREGINNFLFEQPEGDYYVPIAAEGSATMAPLNGLYTTPEIAEAFEKFNEVEALPPWLKMYMRINGAVKYGKTVLSQMTHVRNALGNIGFAALNGHFDLRQFSPAIKSVITNIANLPRDKWRKRFNDYLEQGVVYESAKAGELQDIMKDAQAIDADPERMVEGWIKRVKNKLLKGVRNAYQAEDDVWKIYGYENEYNRYKKAFPDMPEADLRAEIAEVTRNTYPTYSLVPKFIQKLRRFPLVGTFVSFPAEVMRTAYNTVDLTYQAITSDNPRVRKHIGIPRLVGLMIGATGTGSMALATQSFFDVDDEEDRLLDYFVAPWSKYGQRMYLGKPQNGNYKFLDLASSDPHNYIKKPLKALISAGKGLSKEEWDNQLREAGIDASVALLDPFLGTEILAEKLMDIRNNQRSNSNKPVYNPEAPIGDQVSDIYSYLAEAVEPGTVRSYRRLIQGIKGEKSTYGKQYSWQDEIIALFLGQRIQDLDVTRSFQFRTYEMQRRLLDAEQIYKGEPTDENYRKANDALKNILDEYKKMYNGAIQLGSDIKKVTEIVDDSRLSADQGDYVLGESEYIPIERD